MVQFECPRHWKPSVSYSFEVGKFPFPIFQIRPLHLSAHSGSFRVGQSANGDSRVLRPFDSPPSLVRRTHVQNMKWEARKNRDNGNIIWTSGVTCIIKGCLTLSFLKSTSVRGWAKYSWPIACASQSNASKIHLSQSNASKIHLRKRLRYY